MQCSGCSMLAVITIVVPVQMQIMLLEPIVAIALQLLTEATHGISILVMHTYTMKTVLIHWGFASACSATINYNI